jgi:hypothetical protein
MQSRANKKMINIVLQNSILLVPSTNFQFRISMKNFTASLILALLSASVFAGSIEFSYNTGSPTVKEVGSFKVISFENALITGKTGEPSLPYQAVKLLLPPGEEAVSVIYKFENEEIIEGIFTIYPQQPAQPYSVGSDGSFHQDMAVYSSSELYPARAWGEFSTHFLNGHSFLLASFTPLRYIPATGQVSFYQKVIITVETRSTERAGAALNNISNNTNVNKRIESLAQNASMLASYPEKSNREGEYEILIITPQLLENNYQELKDLYLVRGYRTEIIATVTIEDNGTGQDLQEKIRNYIIAEYQAHGIQHVLLGGDEEFIPHRGFYCLAHSSSDYEDYNIPSDLYYSALDGNWNTDGDNMWAEIGEDDLLPDVSVARLPVSNAAQLQRIINKTMLYQDDPVEGELRKNISAGEELWTDPLTYGEDYLELLYGYHDDNGYVTNGVPEDYDFNKLYDSEMYWDGYSLINAINQGTTFIHHSGHANQTYVMRLNISDINNQNFAQTNGINHNFPIIYTHGCLCGAFDENDCIGEAMVLIDNFAVAGAFNSRYGWFNEGQTEGPSAHLHREFVDALYNDKECRIGAAHMISKIETSPWVNAPGQWEEGALRWCFYCCNILGDPMLGVWTDEPMSIVTDYPEYVAPGTTTFPVTVTSNGEPVEGLMCVIMSEGEMMGCCETDANGQAIIEIPAGSADAATAELIVSGNNCLPNYYTINFSVGIDELTSELNNLEVVPNPFSDQANLSFSLENNQPVKISFYEVSGKKLDDLVINGREGRNDLTVNTSSWPEGLIQARIIAGNSVLQKQLLHIRK